jgi:cobalt-zinc-cadmium efflux system outer membrane protein
MDAVRLRTAGEVREAWWSLALARIDLETAEARRQNAERLAADVARRVKAGDLSRADGHQADAAVAGAVAEVARSRGALAEAAKRCAASRAERCRDQYPMPLNPLPPKSMWGTPIRS